MFGYIYPLRSELKCKDFDLYKATYCGLCCTLRERYGLIAPMFLSYDLTFLAMLLEEPEEKFVPCRGRCHGNPFLKKLRSPGSETLNRCADFTVILTWYQLKDTMADDGFWQKIPAFFLSCFLRKKFKKAYGIHRSFGDNTKKSLEKLAKLESESCGSMDKVADCFASILRDTIPEELSQEKKRCLSQILYHVGRWIYLIDARDDFASDRKKQGYNPLFYRYGNEIPQEDLDMTLNHSLYLAQNALDFLDFGVRTAVVENILTLGMPSVQYFVLNDSWQTEKKQKRWRTSI